VTPALSTNARRSLHTATPVTLHTATPVTEANNGSPTLYEAGDIVEVFWAEDGAWYKGNIDSLSDETGLHVTYEDTTGEWIAWKDLRKEGKALMRLLQARQPKLQGPSVCRGYILEDAKNPEGFLAAVKASIQHRIDGIGDDSYSELRRGEREVSSRRDFKKKLGLSHADTFSVSSTFSKSSLSSSPFQERDSEAFCE
jgi:hypothetical protein